MIFTHKKVTAKVKSTTSTVTAATESISTLEIAAIAPGAVKKLAMEKWTPLQKEMSIEIYNVAKTPAMTATSITSPTMTDIASTKMKWNIRQKYIGLTGRSAYSFLNKITVFCGFWQIVYKKYVCNFIKSIDCHYEHDSETYRADLAMALYCAQYKQKSLYCGKNNNLINAKVSVVVCTKFQKN